MKKVRFKKRCPSCTKMKHRTLFSQRKDRPDGLQVYCKTCQSKVDSARYLKKKKHIRSRKKIYRKKIAQFFRDMKTGKKCSDCHNSFHFAAMQWDHLPGMTKFSDVASLAGQGRKLLALEEIKKCELVCANCHAVRTYKRTGCSSVG